jgi:YHS domain-containing protein
MARGGARPGAGRKRGKVGEAKRALAEMAKEHAEAALDTLVEISKGSNAASARVSAATAILDRAYGKPAQALEHCMPDNSLERFWQEVMANATTFRPVEFGPVCVMGLALGKEVQTDGFINAQIDGMTYYFVSEDAKATFMKDPQGYLAKARAYKGARANR